MAADKDIGANDRGRVEKKGCTLAVSVSGLLKWDLATEHSLVVKIGMLVLKCCCIVSMHGHGFRKCFCYENKKDK